MPTYNDKDHPDHGSHENHHSNDRMRDHESHRSQSDRHESRDRSQPEVDDWGGRQEVPQRSLSDVTASQGVDRGRDRSQPEVDNWSGRQEIPQWSEEDITASQGVDPDRDRRSDLANYANELKDIQTTETLETMVSSFLGMPGDLLNSAYNTVRDFISPPTVADLRAKAFYKEHIKDSPIFTGYRLGGKAVGVLGAAGVDNSLVRSAAGLLAPGLVGVARMTNQGYRNAQLDEMLGIQHTNHAPPSGKGNSDRNGGYHSPVFSAGEPSYGQQIASVSVPSLVSPMQMSTPEFASDIGMQEQGATPMPTSTFAPVESAGYDGIASQTIVPQESYAARSTPVMNNNLLSPSEFSSPVNLFNPEKRADDFYKSLNQNSMLWKGGYV